MREIMTARLRIGNFAAEDWKQLQDLIVWYMSSPFADFDHQWPVSDDEIKDICQWFSLTDDMLAIRLKADGCFIGYVSLSPTEEDGVYHLGYCLNGPFHKLGYAYESCKALVDFAFEELGVRKIITDTADENKPSVKLLKKLGFILTGSAAISLRQDEDGKPIKFLGCEYALSSDKK